MKLEYLFLDGKDREKMEAYQPADRRVRRELADIENADCWAAVFETADDSSEGADLLSDVHGYVMAEFRPVVITNESSAYYNQVLFPLFNSFERKLRKLLYFKSALNRTENDEQNIGCLEEQDLGSIFEMLFTDTDFITAAKQRINEKAWKYTKDEILETLNGIPENVLWDSLIGPRCAPTLRKDFAAVRLYRNDTMHAHNMDKDSFKKAHALLCAINGELDEEIRHMIGRKTEHTQTEMDRQFNAGMAAALNTLIGHCQTEEYEKLKQGINERLNTINTMFLHKDRG